jgi:hypothetical protein
MKEQSIKDLINEYPLSTKVKDILMPMDKVELAIKADKAASIGSSCTNINQH